MQKSRLEAFSDGVIAIIITIMVLEIKIPHGDRLEDLRPLIPTLLSYILSFIYVGIYWNNHHHMLHAVKKINGKVLWPNLNLLFWLSLVPITTNWMDESGFKPVPVAIYGCLLLLAAIAYVILQSALIKADGGNSALSKALAGDLKGKISPVLYILGIVGSFLGYPWVGISMYVAVAIIWFIPDKRIERFYDEKDSLESN